MARTRLATCEAGHPPPALHAGPGLATPGPGLHDQQQPLPEVGQQPAAHAGGQAPGQNSAYSNNVARDAGRGDLMARQAGQAAGRLLQALHRR